MQHVNGKQGNPIDDSNNEFLAKIIVLSYYFAALFYFIYYYIIENENEIEVVYISLSLLFTGTVIYFLNMFVKQARFLMYLNIGAILAAYILLGFRFRQISGMTVWTLFFVVLALTVMYVSRSVILLVGSIGILQNIFFMINHPIGEFKINQETYITRIAIILTVTLVILMVNYRYKKRLMDYYFYIQEGETLTQQLQVSEKDMMKQQKSVIEINKRIDHLAYVDQVTGLGNRNAFEKAYDMNSTIEMYDRFAAIYLDIVQLKKVNDLHSHQVGDQYLKLVAMIIKDTFVEGTYDAYRIGDDEFLVVIREAIDDVMIKQYMEIIEKEVTNKQTHTATSLPLKVTGGYAINQLGDSFQQVINHASIAIKYAKEHLKGGQQAYSKKLEGAFDYKLKIQKALLTCVENGELDVVYQPIYNLLNHQIESFEALVRWSRSDLGEIPPEAFIPYAEENKTINSIGAWVFSKAIKDIVALNKNYNTNYAININISTVQLRSSAFVEMVKSVIKETGIQPEMVVLEITEQVLNESLNTGLDIMNDLKILGIKIALDDFGTGFSSVSYLKNAPVDILKIDQSFISSVNLKKDIAIIRSVVEMAYHYGKTVVVEGVEAKEQYELIRTIGCHYAQGSLMEKGLTIEALKEELSYRS